EKETERQTTAAWRRVVDAEHAQGQAEAAAAERAQAVITETQRREAVEARADDLTDQLKAVRRELAAAQTEARKAEQARAKADQRADRAEATIATAHTERDTARAELAEVRAQLHTDRAALAQAREQSAAAL